MRKINAQQLALLLNIPKVDASKKIYVANGIKEEFDKKEPYSIEIKKLSKHLNCDLDFYLNDISKNFLKNQSTGSFILDYPSKKIKPSKTTGLMPRSITIPTVIKSMLSDDVINQVIEKWNKRYAFEVKEHGIIFK
jgi:hypothetical protein